MTSETETREASKDVAQTKRRWAPRFGLSTVLALMVVFSIGSAWWSRTAPIHSTTQDGVRVYSRTETREEGGEPYLTGDYHMVDERGRVLIRGRNVFGEETGVWTSFYPSGYRAARGSLRDGIAVGRWYYWSESGYRRASIEYRAPVATLTSRNPGDSPKWRHGEAVYWHGENGVKAAEGRHVDNQRHGPWRFWDQDRQLIAEGEFRRGMMYGPWRMLRDGTLQDVYYVRDAVVGTPAQVEQRLKQLAVNVREAAPNWRHDLRQLETFDSFALPALLEGLQCPEPAVQAEVLKAIAEIGGGPGVLDAIKPFQDSELSTLRRAAAICQLVMASDGDAQRAALEAIVDNTHAQFDNDGLPMGVLAEHLDIGLAEQIIEGKDPTPTDRLRQLTAFIVVAGSEKVLQSDYQHNERLTALIGKLQSNLEFATMPGLRSQTIVPYFYPAGARNW